MISRVSFLFFLVVAALPVLAQHDGMITRIEFNSGTRGYREQIIFTSDSLVAVKEDFRNEKGPKIHRQRITAKDWKSLLDALGNVKPDEVESLKSPSMNRAHDAAAHGTIIITTRGGESYTHSFDDENPHEKLHPLMKQIRKFAGKK